ncbi:MAG TPA: hypothetical protein DCY79_08975 [Planctomycetaceae bacterium]|nr:hypothetical protein [Blastopirellula sp.]HAY79922.1 hypothetical protein [Planctomycetaceae bacterium]
MKTFNNRLWWTGLLPLGFLCFATGCQHLGSFRCADIPPGAIPQPLGTFACQWQTAQTNRAELDHFVVYQNEWLDRQPALSPFGTKHFSELIPRMQESTEQIRVEPSGDAQLDQQRQLALIAALTEVGVPDSSNRVELGFGDAEALYGVEAPLVSRRFLFSGSRNGGRQGGGGNQGLGGQQSSNISVGVNSGF